MLGGDPDAVYRLPRVAQTQILGWYAATRLPENWRRGGRPSAAIAGTNFSATSEGASYWFGG